MTEQPIKELPRATDENVSSFLSEVNVAANQIFENPGSADEMFEKLMVDTQAMGIKFQDSDGHETLPGVLLPTEIENKNVEYYKEGEKDPIKSEDIPDDLEALVVISPQVNELRFDTNTFQQGDIRSNMKCLILNKAPDPSEIKKITLADGDIELNMIDPSKITGDTS